MNKYGFIIIIIVFSIVYAKHKNENLSSKTIGLIERMNINNIDLPIENNGVTGNNSQAYYPNGQTSLSFLFMGGFATSAYVNGDLRASWMVPAALIEEWQPGIWGMDPTDPLAKFYVVNSNDAQGSQAYTNWANAVNLGAGYQDLNEDGFYDPYTDKPDILGNRTIWFQVNDSTSLAQRTPRLNTLPVGLEMHITVWAEARTDDLGDIIYFRHRILNATDTLKNEVIFSLWADPDIGDYFDDLVGCDTSLTLGYAYNDGYDLNYGSNPPAFGIQMLQGPVVNSIGDTAYIFNGPYFGIDTLVDKKNISMQSFMLYGGGPLIPSPSDAQTARYYQIGGLDGSGVPLDPSQWGSGGTLNTNPLFVFSGDPVLGSGWLDNSPNDKRFLVNFGPFDLDSGEKQDIIIAYIVAQGTNALQSVTLLKNRAAILKGLYPISTNVGPDIANYPNNFSLSQNFPNPFNPITKIKYKIAKRGNVKIHIFNLLGQKIKTLIDQPKAQGVHEVEFNAHDLPSGVYLYRIEAGEFHQTKKMILMK